MRKTILITLVLTLFSLVAQNQEIRPLESGSIIVEDSFLRRNTCIFKTIQLLLTRKYFQQNSEIEVIAAISNLNVDSNLAFQFKYDLNCGQTHMKTCQLDLVVERMNTVFDDNITYELTIDYLIAHGLKTSTINMTYSRQLMTTPFEPFQTAIFIPQGFNDVSITGNIKHTKVGSSNNMVLTYTNPEETDLISTTEWASNKKFVLYKVVYLFHSYKVGNNVRYLFSGFQGSKNKRVDSGIFFSEKQEILSEDKTGYSDYFYLPIASDQEFFDRRVHKRSQDISNVSTESSGYKTRIIIGLCFLVAVQIVFLIIKNRIKRQEKETGVKSSTTIPQLIISFNENFHEDSKTEEVVEEISEPNGTEGNLAREEITLQ